jgi:hypothetical protein
MEKLEGLRRTTRFAVGFVTILALATLALATRVHAQSAQTRQVMREKLELSEILLGALVTSNWMSLNRSTGLLLEVTNRQGWQVLEAPEYVRQTRAFFAATQALRDASGQRDQRQALAAYNGLVASCVECHRVVARLRLASASESR